MLECGKNGRSSRICVRPLDPLKSLTFSDARLYFVYSRRIRTVGLRRKQWSTYALVGSRLGHICLGDQISKMWVTILPAVRQFRHASR